MVPMQHYPPQLPSLYCKKQMLDSAYIQSYRADEHIPALLITGDTAPERLCEAERSGVPLLNKPVSPHQLHREINEILSKKIKRL